MVCREKLKGKADADVGIIYEDYGKYSARRAPCLQPAICVSTMTDYKEKT
jgi:hypothetical protein